MKTLVLSLVVFISAVQATSPGAAIESQVKKLKVNEVELGYVEEGRGAVVLFVHGGGVGDWRSWDMLRPLISQKYRYVSLSRRYHHPNPWIDEGQKYTMAQHVDDVAAFIRGLGTGKVHLVGNSYGGAIVARVALKYPDALRSVAFGEGLVASESVDGRAAAAAGQEYREKVVAAAAAGDFRLAALLQYDNSVGRQGAFEQLPSERQQHLLYNARTIALERRAAPLSCEELGKLSVPALLIRGERTGADQRYRYLATIECLPRTTQAVVIPDAPHSWQLGNPEASAKAILAFVAKH